MNELRQSQPDSQRNPWPIFIVGMATLLIFLPLGAHEFTWWDDWATVHQNPWLNPPTLASVKHYATSIAYGLYVPVTYFVWMGLATVAHVAHPDEHDITLNPWIFHSANVGVHAISAIFVFLLLRQLVKRDAPACLGALLFALHPVQVEPVGWVSGLKDVLSGCFAIMALWRFVVVTQESCDHGDTEARRKHGEEKKNKNEFSVSSVPLRASVVAFPDLVGTIAFVLAMLAKPSAVVVPIIALGMDWLLIRKSLRSAIRATAAWFILAIPILIIGRIAQDVTGIPKAPLWSRPLIVTDTLAFYLYKLLVPIWLAPDYGRTPRAVIENGWLYWTWLAPVTLAIIVVALRKHFAWMLAACFILVAALLPVLGIFTFQFQFTSTVADHYLYLAMLGPALALAFAMRDSNWRIGCPIAVTLLVALAVRTSVLEPVWNDDLSLFTHNLEVTPNSSVAYNNLGVAYHRDGELDKALEHFNRAIALSPTFPNAFNNAAFVLAERGEWKQSVELWEKSLDIRLHLPRTLFPDCMEDHNHIGQVLLQHGQYERAIAHFEALLREQPDHSEAKKYLAIAREKSHQ